jgi:hypothetical protein
VFKEPAKFAVTNGAYDYNLCLDKLISVAGCNKMSFLVGEKTLTVFPLWNTPLWEDYVTSDERYVIRMPKKPELLRDLSEHALPTKSIDMQKTGLAYLKPSGNFLSPKLCKQLGVSQAVFQALVRFLMGANKTKKEVVTLDAYPLIFVQQTHGKWEVHRNGGAMLAGPIKNAKQTDKLLMRSLMTVSEDLSKLGCTHGAHEAMKLLKKHLKSYKYAFCVNMRIFLRSNQLKSSSISISRAKLPDGFTKPKSL